MAISACQAQDVYKRSDQLYSLEEVEAAIDAMAVKITSVLADKDPLVLTLMNGGLIPAGRLLSRLDFPLRQDYVHATRYREETRGQGLIWVRKPVIPLRGRTVLIVDDILDEGYTLAALLQACRDMQAEAVYSALLCAKSHGRGANIKGDFVALQVPDRYVFGYGMDYQGYLRNAPGIFAVPDELDA
jgi:hypoxanthine phosphoribosyltransferase